MKTMFLKFLLFFAKWRRETTTDGLFEYAVFYKTLFGKRHLVQVVQLPPQHFNCRCVVIPAEEMHTVEE